MFEKYEWVDSLEWSAVESASGKVIKIRSFPRDHKVGCSRVEASTCRTDWVVTNNAQDSIEATQKACGFRWKIEELHRQSKQVTGLARYQCRKARIQCKHIACAFLVWGRLKELATDASRTIYQFKDGLLDDYFIQQLCASKRSACQKFYLRSIVFENIFEELQKVC